ncbi:transcriptional regulator, MarR family [Tistlia consotensis]|uniref:Transcriptional regulator, MarR family n=1 Tax=Tistlia consotensis USBA 355 TaxID=560819 RepID=A0A1Y6B6P5_9PROT|nr:MarR family transcriptional regulator [Tistlia consotensis]SME91077.1 transcriptional regulator, MarR family [Tistlia consotensis USBA 355]SNR27086.1 transcriptional regulator, MarR family [Tistlia consotensis]
MTQQKGEFGTEKTREAALAEIANRIFFRLYQSANMMHKTGTRALDEFGVTTQQWAVIGALSRPQAEDGLSVGDLARFLMVSRQNIAGVVTRLEDQGCLERLRDSNDGRSRRIRLSERGRELWRAIRPAIHEYYDEALAGFSFEDRTALLTGLNRLLDNMKRL